MARILLIILASCALVACDSFVDCPVPGWWESILSRIPSWIRDRFLTVNATSMGGSSIHWFRKGLRIHDNPALLSAVEDISEFRPIFILDPWFVKNAHVGPNRWRFLIQSLLDLDESFQKLNSRLFVLKGKPSEIFPKIFKDWGVKKLTFEVDTEPYALKRDEEVMKLARDHGVQIVQEISHTLYDTEKTIFKNGGSPPLTYQRMQALIKQMGNPPASVSTLSEENLKSLHTPLDVDHDRLYGVPSLEELGINTDVLGSNLYPGGETEALRRLEHHLVRKSWICNFEKPKTEPNSLEPSTTVLSPYLKFGCLSFRRMYHRLRVIQNTTKKCTQPPVSLDGQLLWREFFYTVGSATPNFDKMEGNSICRQIPWQDNQTHLEAWKQGRTGYPFIDAIMTQLRKEGWIHHLARHAVACFLTRGDLWISWEHGQQVFEELLLDADWSLNAGNWMWLSASAFFHQYFRVYSPVAFGKKTDKEGQYIKNYLPILKKYPKEYIYEPWKAPRSLQKKAGCIIGVDYPQPIVDHDIVHKQNLKKMADAYAKGKELSTSSAASKRKTSSNESRTTPNPKRKKSSKTNSRITDFMPT